MGSTGESPQLALIPGTKKSHQLQRSLFWILWQDPQKASGQLEALVPLLGGAEHF